MSADILHLLPPSTFLPFVASTFEEAAPERNVFLVYGNGAVPPLAAGLRVERVGSEPGDVDSVRERLASSRVAIVHSMSTFSAQVLAGVPSTTLRVWSGWGGEYYGSSLDPMAGLLGRRTARLTHRGESLRVRAEAIYSARYVDSLLRAAARATDVFSAPVPTDLSVFRRRFRDFRGRYRQLNYASVEDTYATAPDRVSGSAILVGNSATPENNHLELFELLAGLELGQRRIVVPLSYGDQSYAEEISSAGASLFGDRFEPIREFMPLAAYNEIVAACGVVVMGHRRQQALGNVARASWQGAHVYLDRRSPILEFFRERGLSARDLHELAHSGPPGSPKSEQQISSDRGIATSLWSRAVVIQNILALLAEV